MTDVPDDFQFGLDFDANPKILQFISIGVAPAGRITSYNVCYTKLLRQ